MTLIGDLDYTRGTNRKKGPPVRPLHIVNRETILLFCVVLLLAGCGDDSELSAVTGSVSFEEAVTLKPNWRVVVQLADTSFADAPSIVLGAFSKDAPMKAPIFYSIPYDASRIEENHLYDVSASVYDMANTAEPTLLYSSTQSYPVLTNGFGKEVDIAVSAVGSSE